LKHTALDDDSAVTAERSCKLLEFNRGVKSKRAIFGLCHCCIQWAKCPFEWEDNKNDELQSTYKSWPVLRFMQVQLCAAACGEENHEVPRSVFAVSGSRTKFGISYHEVRVLAIQTPDLVIWNPWTC